MAISSKQNSGPLPLSVEQVVDYSTMVFDLDGRVLTADAATQRVNGYEVKDIVGESHSVFYSDIDLVSGLPESHLRVAAEKGRFETEAWRLKKDRSRFWAEIILLPTRDGHGNLVGYVQFTRDLTNRRRGNDAIKRRCETLRILVEMTPNAMVMVNGQGRIEMANALAESMFGYRAGELVGAPIELLVPERFRAHHPSLRKAFFFDPVARPMGAGRDLFGLRRDGSEFPVEIGLNPVETDEGSMVLSAIVDISARKRLEARFRQVVESAPNAMVMINAAGQIEMVNAQTESVFGYLRSELLGQPIEMLVPERFRAHHPGLRTAFFANPASRPMGAGRDLFGLRKDGSEFAIEIGLNPIETDEGTMVLSAIVDISDRRQKEEHIQKALQEKNILLAEIHHRVKNNLQIVYSLLDLQSERVADPVAMDQLRECRNRIQAMALIHQVLYQSQDFATVEFRTVLDSLLPTLVDSYGEQRITLKLTADDVRLPLNTAIPCGLIVNELMTNALKHAYPVSAGGEIRVYLQQLPNRWVTLTVEDDGVGIRDAFDLRQTDTLGLELVNLLTQQLGGDLEIRRSKPTSFKMHFPEQKE